MAIQLSKHHFWQWFLRHHKEYEGLSGKSHKELTYWKNELRAHLRAYFKFLHFSLYFGEEVADNTLTISVAGKARYFKYVDNIVAIAPAIPGWTIQALEAPRPITSFREAKFGDTGIDPHELWCTVPDGNTLSYLTVYHMLCTNADDALFSGMADMAVYNVLGERSFGLNIRAITVGNLSDAPEGTPLIRVEELPAYMPHRQSSLVVDASGEIRER